MGIRRKKPKPKFNHAFDFAFEVISEDENARDVDPFDLKKALLERLDRLSDEELRAACNRYDTFEKE